MKIHAKAVEAAIKAAGSKLSDVDQPLVELARTLAKQMDDAWPTGGPGTRLAATYLTTVRTLIARIPNRPNDKPTRLAELRAARRTPMRR